MAALPIKKLCLISLHKRVRLHFCFNHETLLVENKATFHPNVSLSSRFHLTFMNSNMLQLSEVISDSDFDEIIPLLWHSYSQPRIALLPLLFPSEDDSPEAREKAMQMSKQVFLKMHHADPSGHWLKVLDTDTGEIIGGCRWHVHESDPYEKARGKPFVALTYPEGTERDFASLVLGQILNPRAERYVRPHTRKPADFTQLFYNIR